MRLDKYLVDCGIGSRTEVKRLLKQKEVRVNGHVETSPKRQVDQAADMISVGGEDLLYEQFVYYLLNKPKGVISATEDPRHSTVLDLLDEVARKKSVFPVGRLDRDTHGLLLLTNNGDLAHAMLSPKKHVDKVYQAQIEGVMDDEDKQAFLDGIELKDHTCQPAVLDIVEVDEAEGKSVVRITLREGKFHQVKRMVRARGKSVVDLQRLSMGPLVLDSALQVGDYRCLTEEEMEGLALFDVHI